MSCLFKIKEAGALFTSTEQRIAEYILQNPEKVVEGSAQELARESDTSPAAWIRFSKKLGYKGLPSLKMDLAKDDKENDDLYHVLIEEKDSIETMVRKVQKISRNTLEQTYKLLNTDELKAAIQYLLQASNIYLVGIGGSGVVCTDMMQKLTRLHRSVIYHEDAHVLLARIAHITPEDVLVAISYSGETNLVNAAVKYAKKNGTPVIAITQYNVRSTLAKEADVKLYMPLEEKELRLGAILSRNASLVLTDLIYYGIAKENVEQTKQDLVKTRELLHEVDSK